MSATGAMTAAVLRGKEDVRIERVPVPALEPGGVRVRVRAALTCGTDVKVFRRGYHARMIVPPAVFGHEFAGEIEAIGEGVAGWAVGDRVVAANSAPCGGCFYCALSRPELCEDLLFINGAYAQYISIPERVVQANLLRLPDSVTFEEAALAEPLACVVRGTELTGVSAGETVAVVGVGPIGLMFVRLCKLAGASVIAVGRRPARLEMAREMGADALVSAEDGRAAVATVRELAYAGHGPDRVIECVGRPEVWELAIAMVRKAGTVNLFGGCPRGALARLDTGRVHYDELTLLGSFHHTPDSVRKALELIANGKFPAASFIQERAPLAELPRVLRALANGHSAIKVAIEPSAR